jgi:hypothetical protein
MFTPLTKKESGLSHHGRFPPAPPGHRPIVPLHVARWCAAPHAACSHVVVLFILLAAAGARWPQLHTSFGRRPMAGQLLAACQSASSTLIRSICAAQLLATCCLQLACASAPPCAARLQCCPLGLLLGPLPPLPSLDPTQLPMPSGCPRRFSLQTYLPSLIL